MIKKQSLWTLTLFSLILVLSVYYITLPEELEVSKVNEVSKTTIKEEESNEIITTLKLENETEVNKKTKELEEIINKEESTKEEKNNAYEELKLLNILRGKEDEIMVKIKDKYKIDNFVKLLDDQVRITLVKKDHTPSLASEIMEFVQDQFEEKKYISIKFVDDKNKNEQ